MDEKELRKKIRTELKENHEERKRLARGKIPAGMDYSPGLSEDTLHDEFLKKTIIKTLENELCSQYPEMIKCENHLGETKWLTPAELNDEFEFYPVELSWIEKLQNKFFPLKSSPIPKSEKWQTFAQEVRTKMEEDLKKRIALFRQKQVELQKQHQSEVESKIYQDEIDKFYRSKRGYRKYKNHLGEYHWMTKEEAESQDEYFEEELSLRQRGLRIFGIIVLLGIFVFSLWQFFRTSADSPSKAYLVVSLNEERASFYIGQHLAVGFKANIPYPINPGVHEVSVILSGFRSTPKMQQVVVEPGDTVRIGFSLEKQNATELGFLQINTGGINGSVYANEEFYGNVAEHKIFTLRTGKHLIRIKSEGYVSYPIAQDVEVRPGDTLRLNFELRPQKESGRGFVSEAASTPGLIEVRSNVKNADIYLNGKKTEFKTDYILQKMALGQYVISLQKDGYEVYPEEQVVRITADDRRGLADFILSSTSTPVVVKTIPIDGEIFVNGTSLAKGVFRGSLPLGKHQISFGAVPFYKTPDSQQVEITRGGRNEFIFRYRTNFEILFTPRGISPVNLDGNIVTGHIFHNPTLIIDSENGPEKKFSNRVNSDIWYLGYTFQYRNPPGSDAIVFEFTMPSSIDLSQVINLKIWIYRTKSNYPLVVRGNPFYQIIINNNTFRGQVLPKFNEDEMNETSYDAFIVNEYLRVGKNSIILSAVKETSAEVALWKIALE